MSEYIYESLKYPAQARAEGIKGSVICQFIIDTTGFLNNIEITRDIGGGCGDAV